MAARPPRRQPERGAGPSDHGNLHARLNATCRWCPAQIMWLQSTATGDLAPIDAYPTPGGNVLVERTAAGQYTGKYSVMNRAERGLFDPTTGAPDASPSLHLNHWATCTSSTARRLAAERARAKAGATTVAADGTPLRRPRGAATNPDRLGPPPEIAAGVTACTVCGYRMHPLLIAAGARRHDSCSWTPEERQRVAAAVARQRAQYHRENPGRLTWGERSEQT